MQVNIGKVLAAINVLGECGHDMELHPRLRAIFSQLQVPSFIFSSFRVDTNGPTTDYRFLVGCNPEWIQIYQHRHWYSNDPYLQYARFNAVPSRGSSIQITSAGQRDMRAMARQYGFRSNLIVPAHSRATSLLGVLHVASEIEVEDGGEARLFEWQALLRAMAMTLLDVRMMAQRNLMVAKFELDDRDLTALRLVLVAEPAQEVAKSLGLSVASIYSMYSRINEKMGTNRINEAARLAQQYDLL
ncbi:autoinducer binding domain-containing protein [Paraburkholderia dipogonis]|uniref:autoinducer binding domain-containing protein n=1 Tax=Paraburkholderia dipogonis TaxID=1211383 RepID=UPI0038BB6DAF